MEHGAREHIRSDNGSEIAARNARKLLGVRHRDTLPIEPGRPRENGYIESFNGKLLVELLNGEIFHLVPEAKVLLEQWRRHYSRVRPHSSIGPPAANAGGHQDAPMGAGILTLDMVQSMA